MRWRGPEAYAETKKCQCCGIEGYAVEAVRFSQQGQFYNYCPQCRNDHIMKESNELALSRSRKGSMYGADPIA